MTRRPEILAPAGDRAALQAALAAGADAVYFGLDEGFNARARAANFPVDGLAETVTLVHRGGARAYVTVNTLVFEPELAVVEDLLRRIAAAGVDAVIVQDPAVVLLARAVCPELEVHASTQMTLSSPLAARLAARLGLSRVVVPRELSVDEIRAYAAGTELELEVFVHGALCVSWSGQCLTSESWGGRSANRGQCAQSCRLPYDLVVDDEVRDLGDVKYLLSPRDLAGTAAVPALAEIGVASLKIEGRQKGPQYVATAVAGYRRWRDTGDRAALAEDLDAMALSYTRGQSAGFLGGVDHQTLVEGRFPKHRGLYLGRVEEVRADDVLVRAESDRLAPRAGLGIVFDQGHPEDDEPGGVLFTADDLGAGRWRLRCHVPQTQCVGGATYLKRVRVGDRVWISGDPRLAKVAERAVAEGAAPEGRIGVALEVRGTAGEVLRVRARAGGASVEAESAIVLAEARGRGIDEALLRDKLGGFGGTAFRLEALDASGLAAGMHLPVSELKEVRRRLVAALEPAVLARPVTYDLAPGAPDSSVAGSAPARSIAAGSVLDEVRARWTAPAGAEAAPRVVPLVRYDHQLDAVLDLGVEEVELDWMELVGLGRAVERARRRGVRVGVATVRVQKPGEEKIDAHLARLEPDFVLVRSWGSLAWFAEQAGRPALHGDFSLNVTNAITAGFALGIGLETVTAAHDLDAAQVQALLAAAPRHRVAVTVHHHIPTFHTEHCVYAHLLSDGKDFRTCGRPCEKHEVSLQDRTGQIHPVRVDVGCRNTVFDARAQSAAALVPRLLELGARRLRVELVRESAAETARVVEAYRSLAAGQVTAAEVARRLRVHEQFGVTAGTMRTLTVL